MAKHIKFQLTPEQIQELKKIINSSKSEQRMVLRSKIILESNSGLSNIDISKKLNTREATVSKWRKRYHIKGILGLYDAPRKGKPTVYSQDHEHLILNKLEEPPPKGYAKWNGTLLAKALPNVSDDFIWKTLRKHKIFLQRNRSWCISTDPEFASKAADIVALYLKPKENAVVICVDEKPSIQALSREQGWLKLPDGRAITGFSHEYKRNGTTTLFAAFEVVTGLVKTKQYQRKRRREFLDFMNEVVAQYPKDQDLHVILDNFKTHKPKNDKWLTRHKNVYFHYTPTHASWLNQVEVWFSILSRDALKGKSFHSVKQLQQAIRDFEKAYNDQAHPFIWTKEKVYQKSPKHKLR